MDGITVLIAAGVTGALGIAGDQAVRKRKKAFWNQYGSYEGFRSQVDEQRIRSVQRDRGDIAAVKAVRDNYPLASMAIAKKYVDGL
ncbi:MULTISPECIES: hypothetical protein [Streptomyces]|uniref:hypothetical protein n=1 Tax=Streptomyces TaxID=1883 RepID=UPI001E521BF0|nr:MULTISPECIES: hypothetical protein [Streptomyces]UFQ16859.1 hypothetical protein J2N69_18680 [Streptomyces huasconensis]WCL86462.1 hypothetical protein PPN52_18685 [Streptomyces sp. JCM 35825]